MESGVAMLPQGGTDKDQTTDKDQNKDFYSNVKDEQINSTEKKNRRSPSPMKIGDTKEQQQAEKNDQEFSKLRNRQKYSEYYNFVKLLGQGAFCSVYQAIDKPTGETIAVKVIRRKNLNQNDVYLLRQEAGILKTLDHENIVKFKHIREIGGRIFLGMELLKGGQLTDLIKQKKNANMKFTDEEASSIMRCILQAVSYIHSLGIVHRDLKPDNILVGDPDDLSTIKLADFGLSAKYEHSSFTTLDQHCGTLIFMAPEVALKKEYSRSVDIWSTGIIMYMLLTGGSHPLFTSKDDAESYKQKLRKISSLSFPSHLSILAKNLYTRLTKFNIAQRYTATDALHHPWITRINKSLIPLTLPDKMNHLELEYKLKHKISVMFFASIVKKSNSLKQICKNTTLKDQSLQADPDMANYKRLLNRVTKKIEKWHDEKSKLKEKESFERDEEYIEHEQSPTQFETSDDEGNDESISLDNLNKKHIQSRGATLDGKSPDGNSRVSSVRKNRGVSKTNPNSFKLSLLETNNDQSPIKKNIGYFKNEEDQEFIQYLTDKNNQSKVVQSNGKSQAFQQDQSFQRRKSMKKSSIAVSPPARRENSFKKQKSHGKGNQIITSQGIDQSLNQPFSGITTQSNNQSDTVSFPNVIDDNKSKNQGPQNNSSSFGFYTDSQSTNASPQKHPSQPYHQSVKHVTTKISASTVDEHLKQQQSFINSDRVFQSSTYNESHGQTTTNFGLNNQSKKKNINQSQVSGAGDLSFNNEGSQIENGFGNSTAGYLQQKRGLKSLRDNEALTSNVKKSPTKKHFQQQSYPQQTTTHQINLNDILKKNEGYDQKFLFKKNFIPKQKPAMIANHMLTQQNYYSASGANALNGHFPQHTSNSMQNTSYNQQFQMNYKTKKSSKKSGNKSHSQGGSHLNNSETNNSTKKGTNAASNLPLNYFTLNNDLEERKGAQIDMSSVALKYWNISQNDISQPPFPVKNSTSDLPSIVNKNSKQSKDQYQSANIQLQKSKTGKGYDSKYKASGTNNLFMNNSSVIKEEDELTKNSPFSRPTTQGVSGFNNAMNGMNMYNRNNLNMIEQQYTFEQPKNPPHNDPENTLTQIMSNPFQTPSNLNNKAKMKGLDLSNGSGVMHDKQQRSMKQSKQFPFQDELNHSNNGKDFQFTNKSFDIDSLHQIPYHYENQRDQNTNGLYHKRHKSMTYKQQQHTKNQPPTHYKPTTNHQRASLPVQNYQSNFLPPSHQHQHHQYETNPFYQQSMVNHHTTSKRPSQQQQQNPSITFANMNNLSNGMQQQQQQVILTDNYVQGFTNHQIVKYKNKIIIRQP